MIGGHCVCGTRRLGVSLEDVGHLRGRTAGGRREAGTRSHAVRGKQRKVGACLMLGSTF